MFLLPRAGGTGGAGGALAPPVFLGERTKIYLDIAAATMAAIYRESPEFSTSRRPCQIPKKAVICIYIYYEMLLFFRTIPSFMRIQDNPLPPAPPHPGSVIVLYHLFHPVFLSQSTLKPN